MHLTSVQYVHKNAWLKNKYRVPFKGIPARVWLYASKDSLDANFCLKNRLCSSDERNLSLGPEFAYFVKANDYAHHSCNYVDQNKVSRNLMALSSWPYTSIQISHCASFTALWQANTKNAKGLHTTGVGSVSCACHEMFHLTGTGNLQKGEW